MSTPKLARPIRILFLLALVSAAAAGGSASAETDKPASFLDPNLYRADADARAEISQAIARAARNHKRVMLVFGANWCLDCHVLNYAFHTPQLRSLVEDNFEVVHVDVGEYNRNLDLAERYEIPLKKGIPAAAVLDGSGKLLVSQKNQEFEKARHMTLEQIGDFLNRWKPRQTSAGAQR